MKSFDAKVVSRTNGLPLGHIVCLKAEELRHGDVTLYAELNRQNGTHTGLYIDANELKNSFEIVKTPMLTRYP